MTKIRKIKISMDEILKCWELIRTILLILRIYLGGCLIKYSIFELAIVKKHGAQGILPEIKVINRLYVFLNQEK